MATKRQELTDPNSCLSRAGMDEMLFVLLARDVAAPDTVTDWQARRVEHGVNEWADPQITDAYHCAQVMKRQRSEGIQNPEAPVAAWPSYRHELPTRPGYYWFKNPMTTPKGKGVVEYLFWGRTGTLEIHRSGERSFPVQLHDGDLWSGPLEEPA